MRRLAVTLAATVLLATGFAAAASLGVDSSQLGAGSGAVVACDADGFKLDYTVASDLVTHVIVSDIADPGCEEGRLSLTLTGQAGSLASGGPETVPVDGDTSPGGVTVAVSPQPLAADVEGVHVVVTGP